MEDAQYTRGLSEFIADLKFDDIPIDVVDWMKLLVLDTIGAGLLGRGHALVDSHAQDGPGDGGAR